MPDVSRTEEFRQLIGLHNVHFVPLLKEGLPYVGYEFGCTWDGEHGLGVLMHGSRVVEVGDADTAFTLWIAERDARGAATGGPRNLIGRTRSIPALDLEHTNFGAEQRLELAVY